MSYSVSDLARLVGITVRTLHHYDEIGLLTPSERTSAGYRRYGDAEVERLRQILEYRELGFDLARIKRILDDSAVDPDEQLRRQRAVLREKVGRLEHILTRVENMVEPENTSDCERKVGWNRSMIRLIAVCVGALGVTMGFVNVSVSGWRFEAISAGIAEAIVTTAAGLILAVPLIWLYGSFRTHRRHQS